MLKIHHKNPFAYSTKKALLSLQCSPLSIIHTRRNHFCGIIVNLRDESQQGILKSFKRLNILAENKFSSVKKISSQIRFIKSDFKGIFKVRF